MKIEQRKWTKQGSWNPTGEPSLGPTANLVLLFGSREIIANEDTFQETKKSYPNAHIIGCSTAGEICDTEVTDDTLILTAIEFEKTEVKACSENISDMSQSTEVGEKLAEQLPHENLSHVFVLSDGLNVNGSELVTGICNKLPKNITVTGGLSGDGGEFQETYVIADKPGKQNTVSLIGFYSDSLKIGYSSVGGWDSFGPERVVTKSESNVLYELDGQSALDLYKHYLGEEAKNLPASGLRFPLTILEKGKDEWIVRTLLAVDEDKKALIFAGDVPHGASARLMKANYDRLINGAKNAAENIVTDESEPQPELAILISCVGRKLILKGRIEEEVEAVRDIYGESTVLTGFYSYGEISPFSMNGRCQLHNQTMTITTFNER